MSTAKKSRSHKSSNLHNIFAYDKYWAECYGISDFLPHTREEMEALGWDSCDVVLVTGDAYVDHPSFGMALIGRLLESQGFRVGIIDQPDWQSCEPYKILGKPNLFYGVTAGNMDSMINRYTADRKLRHDDAYTPDDEGGKRPDHAVSVYTQRCKEAWSDVPVVIGGIEASLRRIAHYDYWSDKVKRSILVDSKADLLVFGNGERQITEIAHRLSRSEDIAKLDNIRGTAYMVKHQQKNWMEIDSSRVDRPGKVDAVVSPYKMIDQNSCSDAKASKDSNDMAQQVNEAGEIAVPIKSIAKTLNRERSVIRLPSYEKVIADQVLYAHASRVLHLETNPGNARALVQRHGDRDVWLNPPPFPLTTEELDQLFELPYKRTPHSDYEGKKMPAYEMIRFSINIMRGCFGGCTFCSITEHEGRIIQNRSEDSIIREIEEIRDNVPEFKGYISDLGGPTANMWRLACDDRKVEAACRRLSCVFPKICSHMNTDHGPLTHLYQRARQLPGIKKVFVASGLRYDLAVRSPEYVKELVTHHVGGYLKIAPEHTEEGTLSKMMKPKIDSYYEFKQMFEQFSKEAGKEQYLIPYFIAAHPGTTIDEMINLALWLKENDFRLDQVQNFYPSPMATATTMYHSERNPLKKLSYKSEKVLTAKGEKVRRLHKSLLRYHDPKNWPQIRETLREMGRHDLIGDGDTQLVPAEEKRKNSFSRGAKTNFIHRKKPKNKRASV
ncbi:YgiQ family radical SAM protein [sulfur-oxidizing endosymbiont of Gigantopelta aegis]|uniref:YgiQ family radical SAM protein n=1 Tax=sulfur-oxidizing endosymbiont of Gigantopelta aegis TaxID=2794934 RepID=UPI0018DD6AD0|nr:YgiQ family radical SAM protein [sulfur-oxidizing endosymbiont of Gigantopelta aegis]